MTRIAIIGPYLLHNFGDDLIGSVLTKFFQEKKCRVLIPGLADANRHWLGALVAGGTADAIRRADGVVIGGGGIFGDTGPHANHQYYGRSLRAAAYAALLRRRLVVAGVGAGPVQSRMSRFFVEWVCRLSRSVAVRDAESAVFLRELGLSGDKIVEGADPALLWPDYFPATARGGGSVGIQFDVNGYAETAGCAGLEGVCRRIRSFISDDTPKLLLSTGAHRTEAAQWSAPSVPQAPYVFLPDFLNKLSGCRSVFSSHLHLCVAAFAARIPCFSIYVKEKSRRFFDQIGHPERAIPIAEATSENTGRLLAAAASSRWTGQDEDVLTALKARSRGALESIFKKLENA